MDKDRVEIHLVQLDQNKSKVWQVNVEHDKIKVDKDNGCLSFNVPQYDGKVKEDQKEVMVKMYLYRPKDKKSSRYFSHN